jgi:hypothetical protein
MVCHDDIHPVYGTDRYRGRHFLLVIVLPTLFYLTLLSLYLETMSEFTIRITGAAPPPFKKPRGKKAAAPAVQQRYNLRISPSTTLHELQSNVFALFNVAAANRSKYAIEFMTGFPPTFLDKEGKNTVDELGIRPNETVIVKISLLESAVPAAKKPATNAKSKAAAKQETNDHADEEEEMEEKTAEITSTTRTKRAAAEAATSTFKEVIKAQNAMMKSEKKATKPSTNSRISTINNIASLSSSPKKQAAKRPPKMEGVGYRLSDSQAIGSPSKRTRRTANTEPMFSSKDDIATTLLSSMSGKGKGNVGNFLRAAMKGAVMKSYEVSRAQVRVSAVQNGDYQMERVKGGSVVDGGVVLGVANDDENALGRTMYQVSYGKGIEGRGRFSEQVEIIGLDALKSTIQTVYNSKTDDEEAGSDGREMLRPAAIAQMSPRMFWSLVYHCTRAEHPSSSSSSIESMLRDTMPDLDWTHLDRGGRKRNLSEKAKENLRQETKADTQNASDGNVEDEVRALEEFEETIMNGLDEHTDENLRQKRLAALSRFNNNEITEDWKLITPVEDDEDELKECILDQNDGISEVLAKTYSSIMMNSQQPCCRNWRELANVSPESLSSKFNAECSKLKVEPPSDDSVINWIDAAQQRSLEEIMLEILDSDQDALELLSEKANSANPWDLIQWSNYPQLLLDAMETSQYSVADAACWISRAKVAIETSKWLEDYSVSIV